MKKAFDVYKELVIAKKKRGEFKGGRRLSEKEFNRKNFGGLPTKKQDRELKKYLRYSMEYDRRRYRLEKKGYEMHEKKLNRLEFETYLEGAKTDLRSEGSSRDPMKYIISKQQYELTAKAARAFREAIPEFEKLNKVKYEDKDVTFEKIRLGAIDTEELRLLYHSYKDKLKSVKKAKAMVSSNIFGSP